MTYLEIAVSDGPGTLTSHVVIELTHPVKITPDMAVQTMTEEQAQEFHAMHGGWIAV